MITMPAHVTAAQGEGHTWDGNDIETGHANKQTTMDWAEHQRIVCEARSLVQGEPPATYNSEVKKVFNTLKSAYNDSDNRITVGVTKGIHQPTVNPHLQLRVSMNYGGGNVSSYKFHLDVTAESVASPGLEDDRYQWKGVQFSFEHPTQGVCKWPLVAPAVTKKGALKRRLSISAVGLQAHMDEQLRLEREAQIAAEKKAFDDALTAFIATYGNKSGNITHNAANAGDFPTANFRKGNVNAKVSGGGNLQSKMVYYDKTKKEIVIGQAPRG